jgi:hypothetical protein
VSLQACCRFLLILPLIHCIQDRYVCSIYAIVRIMSSGITDPLVGAVCWLPSSYCTSSHLVIRCKIVFLFSVGYLFDLGHSLLPLVIFSYWFQCWGLGMSSCVSLSPLGGCNMGKMTVSHNTYGFVGWWLVDHGIFFKADPMGL